MTDNKKVVKGNLLGRVRAAEESLAREAAKKLETALPDGHPLKAEVEKQKALLGGDLTGLPPGHPLLRALEVAKVAYEAEQAANSSEIQTQPAEADQKIKKAKKISEAQTRQHEKVAQDDRDNARHRAAKEVNQSLDCVLVNIRKAWQVLGENEAILGTDMFSRRKVVRVRSLLAAVERGLTDNRISRM